MLISILRDARKIIVDGEGNFPIGSIHDSKKKQNLLEYEIKWEKQSDFNFYEALILTKIKSVKEVIKIIESTNDINDYLLSDAAQALDNADIKGFYAFKDYICGYIFNAESKVDRFVNEIYQVLFDETVTKFGLKAKSLEELAQEVFSNKTSVVKIIADFKQQYIKNNKKEEKKEVKNMARIKKVSTVKTAEEIIIEAKYLGIATENVAIEVIAKNLIQKYESRKNKANDKKAAEWQTRIDAIVALVPNAVVIEETVAESNVTTTVAEEIAVEAVEEKEEENMEENEDIDVEEFLYGDVEEVVVVAEATVVTEQTEAVVEETETTETTVVVTEEPKVEVQADKAEETVKQEVAVENKTKKKEKKKMEKKTTVDVDYTKLQGEELMIYLRGLTSKILKGMLKERGVKGFAKADKQSLVNAVFKALTETESVEREAEKKMEENPIRAKLAELGVVFTDERYAVLSIEELTGIFNIINKTVVADTVVDNSIPLESVKEEKVEQTTEVVPEEPKVETATEQAKEVVDEAPKTTEPKKQTTTRLATIEEAWTASNATKVMKRIVGMAQKNYCINFISDFMVTSAIHEMLFGRPTKNYKTGEVSVFTTEEEALTVQFKTKFVEQYLIPNDKGTGYTIKSVAMAWNYKDVLYRYRGKGKDGKDIVVDYLVNYKDKTLQMRGSENVHVLNIEAFAKLDRTCTFINVIKKAAPKGAANAPKNNNKTPKKSDYKERMDALIAESEAKVKEALKSDDATVKEALANELKTIASKSDRVVERELLALVKELMGKQVA